MKIKRQFLCTIRVMFGLAILAPSVLFAERYPDHPIQLVIPNAAGSSMDLGGRMNRDN
jgi:tripartite-type tricarboxylate transporter receptor subunit TctC